MHWGGDDEKNRAVRIKNLKKLREIVDHYRNGYGVGYVILADLNITWGTDDYKLLMEIFKDCGGCENQITCDPQNSLLKKFHPEYICGTKIDYILWSKKHCKVEESKVLDGGGDLSDHYAVYSNLIQRIDVRDRDNF